VAGVNLAKATDLLDDRYGLGEALGGMILLSVAGSLPELAITTSAAVAGNLGMAAGNLIGRWPCRRWCWSSLTASSGGPVAVDRGWVTGPRARWSSMPSASLALVVVSG
jgi:hypothetical protein